MAEYIIQKAVSPDAVKKKLQRSMGEYAETFEAQPKRDGCCAILVITDDDNTGFAQSRTGEPCRALQPAVRYFSAAGLAGYVLIGEAWWPGKDQFHIISGEFRRHAESTRLGLVVNDCLALEEFNTGHSPVEYVDRMARLEPFRNLFWNDLYQLTPRHEPGSYGDPQALCNTYVDAGGHDGLILRDPKGTWTRGRGTTGEIVKIKRSLSFDLRVTAVYPGEGKHAGRMGALGLDFGGKELRVGTGFTDIERERFFRSPETIIGTIAEVEAMDHSADGLLREPRFKGVRFDKLEPDTIAA